MNAMRNKLKVCMSNKAQLHNYTAQHVPKIRTGVNAQTSKFTQKRAFSINE